MATFRPKKAVAPSTIPPTTSAAASNMPPTTSRSPSFVTDVTSLKSKTFLGINTTVPLILWLLSKIPNIFVDCF
ncbi:hypothetical protein TSUD_223620 [Trifolium subterraneum]|uniref:Uncharacterized protein n=1 Tax=Trifolium subterraneum TaxID=3900 RepID=A0A2Z6MB46_TRISU|nr:hypothetical protein TSUD_223620 [Trifolium subterraneum]